MWRFCSYLIPWSMLPDVIEWDELQTGQRREGIYYGFMVFLRNWRWPWAYLWWGKRCRGPV
ncbi:MFS transporter [Synechococcus elongatus]|uniref:MFS transporter n=1 Tax=Synechococcus elongatus TaxID=32046 RepID=UPI0030D2F1AD